jgi:cell division transport system permease protein
MKKTDIPFSTDDSHAFLPWVIGIMVGLAGLLLCLGLTVDSWMVERHQNYEKRFTVNIPAGVDDLDKKMKVLTEVLEGTKGINSVSQVTKDKLQDMLKPWIGRNSSLDNLPLPTVLDVTMDNAAAVNLNELQTKLSIVVSGVEIDSHEQWVANFSDFSATLGYLVVILAVLIISGLSLTIAFTSRAALKLHARTIGLLHSIGAEDGYIARQFQRDACRLTLYGTVPGCIAAGLIYWATGFYMQSLGSSMLPSLAMNVSHLILLLALPLTCAAIAWLTARVSVLQQLQHKL